MIHDAMPAQSFCAVLEYLTVEDASVAFGVPPSDIVDMSTGAQFIPFLVSLAAVLMCESAKATRLAPEHGRAMRSR